MIALTELDAAGRTLIADTAHRRAGFEAASHNAGVTLVRPALNSEPDRTGRRFLTAFRPIIESVNQTLEAQLDLEGHGGRTRPGVAP